MPHPGMPGYPGPPGSGGSMPGMPPNHEGMRHPFEMGMHGGMRMPGGPTMDSRMPGPGMDSSRMPGP